MLCMFGQLSPLLGDLKRSLLRTGIACSRRHSFGFFGSLPVFFRSFHVAEQLSNVTISDGTKSYTVSEFSSVMALWYVDSTLSTLYSDARD